MVYLGILGIVVGVHLIIVLTPALARLANKCPPNPFERYCNWIWDKMDKNWKTRY